MSAAAKPEIELPGLDQGTGTALGAGAAREALDEHRNANSDDDELEEAPASPAPADSTLPRVESKATGPGETTGRVNGAPPAPKAEKPPKVKKVETPAAREKRVKKMRRDDLAVLHLDLLERHAELERKQEELERTVAVNNAVGSDVVNESLNDFVGDVVDLADSGVEFAVRKLGDRRAAPAVALESDEREHLVKLWARYAKLVGGEYVQQSPLLAAIVGTGALILAKAMGYEAARLDLEPVRPGLDASRETVAAAQPVSAHEVLEDLGAPARVVTPPVKLPAASRKPR